MRFGNPFMAMAEYLFEEIIGLDWPTAASRRFTNSSNSTYLLELSFSISTLGTDFYTGDI